MAHLIEIDTDRLRLIPLDFEEITSDDHELIEKKLGLQLASMILGEQIDRDIKNAMRKSLENVIRHKREDEWYVEWESVLIVLKKESVVIGGFCFQIHPDEKGRVQLGYMIRKEYQGNGYMTEALKGGISWIFEHRGVTSIIAETTKSNIQSQKVLKKVGMVVYKETPNTLWWRLDK